MSSKLNRLLDWFREESVQAVRRYPVEIALMVCFCIGCLYCYEVDSDELMPRLSLVPLFALLALVVNHLAGSGPWRKLYWVCWTPILPLWFWPGLNEWITSPSGAITFMVLTPLAVLLCRRAVQNDRFVCDTIVWLRSAVLAVVFVGVALGLFCAILYSTTYIFGLEGSWIQHVQIYAMILFSTLGTPLLFLMMSDRWLGAGCKGSRIVDVLINYIVTPALLVYTAILYLYMLKILVSWELPRGGVAYLVFGFTLTALIVQALQQVLQKRIYDWFFNNFSLITLPTQVLFWIGTLYRISEYGVTTARVYLLVCGGLMTLCVALFLSRKLGRYFWVGLAAWGVFALLAYVPGLSPNRIATRSQAQRAERIALGLNMLSDDGALRFEKLAGADSLKCAQLHDLYEALDYIEMRDSAAFARFGLEQVSDFTGSLPAVIREQVIYGWDATRWNEEEDRNEYIGLTSSKGLATDIKSYSVMYTDLSSWDQEEPNYSFENDTLCIWLGKDRPELRVSGRDILTVQLAKIGAQSERPDKYLLEERADEMLTFRDDKVMILFSNINLIRRDSTLQIDDVTVSAVLMQ